jgi:hypothetical protein
MKLILVSILSCFLTFVVKAQDPDQRIFETQWYLTSLVVNGNNVEIPETSEISGVELFLQENRIETLVCDGLGSDINDFDDISFIADTWFILPMGCVQQATLDFQEFYFEEFLKSAEINILFTYTLEEVGNEGLRLTIVNSEGDTAVYGNPALGVQNSVVHNVSVFPNPATDFIHIQLFDGLVAKEVRMYSIQGAMVHQQTVTNSKEFSIAISKLVTGNYFITIIDKHGKRYIKRIVKE